MSANQIMIIQPIINKNTQLGNKYFENVYRQYRKSNFAFKQRNGDMESQFNFTNELTSWFNDIENNIRRKNNKYRKFQYSIRSITVFQLFKDYKKGSLKDILELERKGIHHINWNLTLKYIISYGIAAGMAFLHSNCIIHRDLKQEIFF